MIQGNPKYPIRGTPNFLLENGQWVNRGPCGFFEIKFCPKCVLEAGRVKKPILGEIKKFIGDLVNTFSARLYPKMTKTLLKKIENIELQGLNFDFLGHLVRAQN